MNSKKTIIRPSCRQLNILLVLLYFLCILLVVLLTKNLFVRRDAWLEANNDIIFEYSAEVTKCIYHRGRSPYYEIEMDLSNGVHLQITNEKKLEGTIPIYGVNINGNRYYEFTKEALFVDAEKGLYIIFWILFALLVLGPGMLYLHLREVYGYGIRLKKFDKIHSILN